MEAHRLFSRDLIVCIRDGRFPLPSEIARLSKRLWSEGVSFCAPQQNELAGKFALIAFSGSNAFERSGRNVFKP